MKGIWCKKIGMTQIFSEQGVCMPVTVLEISQWRVMAVRTSTVVIGHVREKYVGDSFENSWLNAPHTYFSIIREIPCDGVDMTGYEVGAVIDPAQVIAAGTDVHVSGLTIGRGFQGGVKRHGFAGGRGSHGDKLGRQPGSMGFMRSRGRVIKGWRMAGHMGVEKRTIKNLQVISVGILEGVQSIVLKGSVPGKSGSLVLVRKR